MINYMKYEIRGTYKYILGVLALVLILMTGIFAYISRATGESLAGNLFIALSVMVLFATALVTFLFIVGSFRKELYEDRGYLTFSLPLTGYKIVGSKLIVALLWFTILGLVIGIYNLVMAYSFFPVEVPLAEIFSMFLQQVSWAEIVFVVLTSVFGGVNLLVLIYFSMALSKVTFRNKRIGGFWFIIFLILSGILAFGQFGLSDLFPYYLDLNTFSIGTMGIENSAISFHHNNSLVTGNIHGGLEINIAASLYNIITTVALFFGTGYLIEKKIDL
ncbi:hypothetical protein [Calidifontibacillus oryziterrae]|uniref:hypothetical protein n=1 Tax=Calidifontibacillus oryziterrae TaxID=1191699 RepID=UPI0002FCE279|nr:hypothetical protein [Calidifontibacillus oryziterrae]